MRLREIRCLKVMLVFAPVLLGLGGGAGAPTSDTIPRPKENHGAELVDRGGVSSRVEFLACGGRTFFPLQQGEGTLMVPFAKSVLVTVEGEGGGEARVRIRAASGTVLDGTLPGTLLCTGATEYGNFQVELGRLKEIRLVKP